jgi:plasmid replication initiation protein
MKLIPYQNNKIAVLSNEVCKSSYQLSVGEHRLLKLYLQSSKNYFDEPIDTNIPFSLTIRDYASNWGLELFNARKEVREAAVSLAKRELYKFGDDNEIIAFAHWASDIIHNKDLDTWELYWSRTILAHISELKERFTKLDLTEMKDFSSSYSFRLYEILMCSVGENSYRNPSFEVETLMTMMQVPESYRNYRAFKARVLTPCTKELLTKTGKFSNLSITEIKQKGSKKVISLEFSGCGIGNRYKKQAS